jgi:hypothetical protein
MSIMKIAERSEVPFFLSHEKRDSLGGLRALFARAADIISEGDAVAAKEGNAFCILICNSFFCLCFSIFLRI